MPPKTPKTSNTTIPLPPKPSPKLTAPSKPTPSIRKPTLSSPFNPTGQLRTLTRSIDSLREAYTSQTPARIKTIDAFLVFYMILGVLLMGYRIGVTSYPFNGFLAAFGGTAGQFVLLAGLRSQVSPDRDLEFSEVSPERAFADFCFASVVLHVFMFNFLG